MNYSYSRQEYDDKIIDLMIGFECLFINASNKIGYRIAERASKFIGGKGSEDVFTFIKEAYDLRSKIVHGSVTKNEIKTDRFKINSEELILIRLKNYLRLCLLKYIQQYSQVTHDDFIGELDKK